MQPTLANDPATWNETLQRLPVPHVLQSWEWGAFKARHGWSTTRWLLQDAAGTPRAAALVLRRRLARLPVSLLYVPKGPLFDHSDDQARDAVLAHLERLARQQRAILVKIDPDVRAGEAAITARLRERGWRPSREQIQFRNTLTLDLEQDEETLLGAMKSKWRYNIRLAARKGVTVRPGTLDDLPLLYEMYRETALRDNFVIRPLAYYRDAWGSFMAQELARPLIAQVNGDAVAMVILFRFGDRAWYMYGASRNQHRDKMPNHLLQWQAMRWAKSAGCRVYDMWGAPDEPVESDPMWGVYRFKLGFGATFVRHVGAYDYPTSKFGYWIYSVAMPRLLALMRRRYWRRTSRDFDKAPFSRYSN
jgi:lipid II:glycine glycyltransferase (peptidoglycan interpeptide bridge formation enzyme)